MPGNTTFFAKAGEQKITWKDIFSNVFKKHSSEDGARLFMAGTPLTTPHESRMLSEWQKPWLFAYIGIAGILFIVVMYVSSLIAGHDLFTMIPVVFVSSLIIPLTILILMWELNIPRNIPIYSILLMLLIGGGFSFVFDDLFRKFLPQNKPAYWAPLTEEPAKLFALCIFLWKPKTKYILNGILIGTAIGAGFASMETMGYFIQHGYGTLVFRGLLAPGGHVVWAALYGGALAMAKGDEKLSPKHFIDKRFLIYFAIAFVLHFLWNRFGGIIIYTLLTIVAWFFLLWIIKRGVLQCMQIPQIASSKQEQQAYAPAAAASAQASPSFSLKGISGNYAGNIFPVSGGKKLVLGRDPNRANIVYPQNTPGISSVHCEIYIENGEVFLTDKGSSNGTFLADGTKLAPEKPCALNGKSGFYLATRDNLFEIE